MPRRFDVPTLRFVMCGSIDDGKSTLIGRLLYEADLIREDELRALTIHSKRYGTQGERLDLALLVDGLQAEREQGITIDVAYRYFATPVRRFIVADAPGHEQYTRNMASGASTANVAVILVDARKGFLHQTRRHTRVAAMMGIRHMALAVNKMDLVGYHEGTFRTLATQGQAIGTEYGLLDIQAIPVSALEGDNVVRRSAQMSWYQGATLLEYLERVDPAQETETEPLRMPVQWINRPHAEFRAACGRVAAGTVRPGDRVRVLPSGIETRVQRIVGWEGDLDLASAGDSTTLVLVDEVDVSRGDVIVGDGGAPAVADQFQAKLLWFGADPLVPGRSYILKLHCKEVPATVMSVAHREDIDTGAPLAAATLSQNDIGVVTVATAQPVVLEPYGVLRTMGGFILIDRFTFETVGAGMLVSVLARAWTVPWQSLTIRHEARALQKHQTPFCIWFTGLSGAGKSTIANALEQRLFALGRHTYLLDGDNIRHGLNRDLGFTDADRVENIRRVAEVARLMVDAGLIVLVSFISPFRAERQMARELFRSGGFVEVFVDAPLDVCEQRDPKGLYARARRGDLPDFTGLDSPYEVPESPDIHLRTAERSIEECVQRVLQYLGDSVTQIEKR